jgi:hypothetical protein
MIAINGDNYFDDIAQISFNARFANVRAIQC